MEILPERSSFAKPIKTPSEDVFKAMKESTGNKEMSTTMVLGKNAYKFIER